MRSSAPSVNTILFGWLCNFGTRDCVNTSPADSRACSLDSDMALSLRRSPNLVFLFPSHNAKGSSGEKDFTCRLTTTPILPSATMLRASRRTMSMRPSGQGSANMGYPAMAPFRKSHSTTGGCLLLTFQHTSTGLMPPAIMPRTGSPFGWAWSVTGFPDANSGLPNFQERRNGTT